MGHNNWQAAAVLRVKDVRASATFYRQRLGFDCPEEAITPGVGDEGAVYAIARRNGVMVHLGRARTGQVIDPGRRPNALGLYLYVDDVDAVHAELVAHGASVSGVPKRQPYGIREVWVIDPDGYMITFGGSGYA